tara:strand:- start:662 stop:1150 length:489 start_codon:yes stop_codon:yes gene_type:complete
MIFQNKKFILNGILFFSIISLSFAYFVQYILGHKPCNLCLIERYPYLGAIIFISIFFIINKYEKIFLFIILLFFIFGSVISIYHVGIEFGFFSESSVCGTGNLINDISKEELLKKLEVSAPISCKDVTFKLFGLSLATINAIISIIISVILLLILKNYVKNR